MIASFETGSTEISELALGGNVVSRRITLAAGQNLNRGSVLGRITASGKYVLAAAAASDGSQTPSAILAETCNAFGTDTQALGHFGGTYLEDALTFGLGVDALNARDALRGVGIFLQSGQAR